MPVSGLGWRGFVHRHERSIAAGYLALVAVAGVLIVAPPTRVRLLQRLEATLRWWDARWQRRLDEGERLLRSGHTEAAVAYLERIDRIHPATNVRHGRDKERERLLILLAGSYEASGRRGRAVETHRRLVEFDSLNYRNHYLQAKAAERLLSGWALAPEARDAYEAVLRIAPYHLPSMRGVVDYYMDRGEFVPVVAAYRRYLDAHLVQRVEVGLGDSTRQVGVVVDGRVRDYEIAFGSVEGAAALTVATGGFSLRVAAASLEPAQQVGRAVSVAPLPLDLDPAQAGAMESAEPNTYRPVDSTATLRIPVPRHPGPIARVRLRLALFKPVDEALWGSVEKSFRNLLDEPGLSEVQARTVTLKSAEAADLVLSRLRWAREGLGLRSGERPF